MVQVRGALPRPSSSRGPRCSSPASSPGCRKPARQRSPPPPGLLGPGLCPTASLSSQDCRSRSLCFLRTAGPAASVSSQDRRSRSLCLLSGPQVPAASVSSQDHRSRSLCLLRTAGPAASLSSQDTDPHSLFLLSGLQILTASLLSGLNVPAASLRSGLQVLTSCLSSQDFRSSFADIDSLLEIEPRNGPAQKLRQEVNRSLN